MSITIKPEHVAAWQAVVDKVNAARAEGAPAVTLEDYAQARLDEIGASYQATLIEEAKRQYDDFVTLAAKLPDAEKAELLTKVQELAVRAGIL